MVTLLALLACSDSDFGLNEVPPQSATPHDTAVLQDEPAVDTADTAEEEEEVAEEPAEEPGDTAVPEEEIEDLFDRMARGLDRTEKLVREHALRG